MDRLVKRRDFVAAASGLRANSGPLLLQGRDRKDEGPARIGLTVTKKHGNAVERNRIRRRLRAAVREALPSVAKPGFDYVIVARRAVIDAQFQGLIDDISRGVARLHSGSRRRPSPPRPSPVEGAAGSAAAERTAAKERPAAAQPPARADGDAVDDE